MTLCQPYSSPFLRRSHCDCCGFSLKWVQLIPIYSSLIGRFRCQNCRHQPSPCYGIVEFILGFVFALNAWNWSPLTCQIILQLYSLLALHISLWDWRSKTIPLVDIVLFFVLTLSWIIFHKIFTIKPLIILVLLLGLKFIWNQLNKPWVLSEGDWVLFVLAASWITAWQLPTFLALSGGIGILTALCYQSIDRQTQFFPFAPAILIALWLTLLWN